VSVEPGYLSQYSDEATAWAIGVLSPALEGNFSILYLVQTGSGTQPASYPTGSAGSFSGGKTVGA